MNDGRHKWAGWAGDSIRGEPDRLLHHKVALPVDPRSEYEDLRRIGKDKAQQSHREAMHVDKRSKLGR